MSKKSKMKEREEASYIAPCEDVVVELPFMVKRVMRGRRPSNVYEDDTCIIDEDNL